MWAAVMIRLMDTSVKRTWASSAQQASISRFRFSSGNRKNVAVGTVSPLYDRLSQCDRLSCIIQKPLYPVKAGIVKLLLRCLRTIFFHTFSRRSTKCLPERPPIPCGPGVGGLSIFQGVYRMSTSETFLWGNRPFFGFPPAFRNEKSCARIVTLG